MNSYFAKRNATMSASLLLLATLLCVGLKFTAAKVGVCYGTNGNNLPTKQDVINLYKSRGITRIRIYDPDETILQALRGSNIEVILGVPNDALQSLTNAAAASNWVNKYVKTYSPAVTFRYIAVGNEVPPGDGNARNVLPAMRNIQSAISVANLQGQIKVSTAIATSLLGTAYPPKDGFYSDSVYIKPIIEFLVNNGAPLLANVYPYFAHTNNQQKITLAYALFTQHGKNEVGYQNVFDALLDSLYAANEKLGAPNLKIVVSESGWPSEGGVAATLGNAGTYYKNLINHAKGGTPKKPSGPIETYLFAMFDENMKKGAETEKHFGLFRPDKSAKYQLTFN